ncbi:hypothetical protein CLOM_g14254 [Closterium sp. NIES-68]|nr:hypothetical protein CLOM_g23090 [Closterium sp. NIES-68]GJP55273.1 hypothetical protein CLOM_g14254 [Closterium sp. NIES-68]GJP76325.1 hypothetical protein CLOP_g6787 [Closterium sp. NIES-67]GJP77144.1 hypothetical protein CLOP_g7576 [Closterium sp. NIES-67]
MAVVATNALLSPTLLPTHPVHTRAPRGISKNSPGSANGPRAHSFSRQNYPTLLGISQVPAPRVNRVAVAAATTSPSQATTAPGKSLPDRRVSGSNWSQNRGSSGGGSSSSTSTDDVTTVVRDISVSLEGYDSSLEYLQEQDSFSRYSGYIARAAGPGGDEWAEYDARAMGEYFRARPLLVARRLAQIGAVAGAWAGKRWVDAKLGRAEATFKERAAELRQALVLLGPAFVKIAQAVSSRPDVIPPAYVDELSLLQDRIAPFPTRTALDMIEAELGVPVDLIFDEISPSPVAAASLGQVYQARLRAGGQRVAVKVQRPGVRAAIALDIFILRILAGWLRQYRRLNTDLKAVVDEWATSLFREMDYEQEAQNGIRFAELFGRIDKVVVPRMYPELTTRRVLIMEWIDGQRLADSKDVSLVEVGVYCSLSQLLDYGFYHADPHPGNFLLTYDNKLAYLDFGMMGSMDRDVREAFIRAAVHLVNREFELLAGDFVTLGLLPPGQETSEVSYALTEVFKDAVSSGVRNISFGSLATQLGQTMYNFKFRLPAYFSLVVRSLSVLEGIALKRDPNYKVIASSYPWIAKKVLTDPSPQLRSTVTNLLFKDGQFRASRLESLLKESSKPMYGPDSAAKNQPTDDTSKEGRTKTLKRILKFGLSEEGRFIRELLLDEVAKGLDALNRITLDSSSAALLSRLPPALRPALFGPLQLATPEDEEHLENLQRLATIVADLDPSGGQGGAGSEGGSGGGEEREGWAGIQAAVDRATVIIQRLPSREIFTELPLPAQQTALLLPVELAGRVASRTVARTIRSNVGGGARAS